jgi:CubicO group peptidase (beta-lactamase class C family)
MNVTLYRFLGFALASLIATVSAHADQIDDFVQSAMKQQKIPGLSLVVIRDGAVVKAKGYGLSNLELSVAVKPETVFQSGSMGKQFTATAIMMLVEEGKLGLDDKISKYFSDSPKSWRDITVRHLLTHTSGIKDYTGADLNFRQDYNEDDLLKKVKSFPLDFKPGDKWSYSNTGYMLLGILIHRVTEKFYGDFLQERVFRPLGMTSTRIINEADIIPNRAAGYRRVKGEWKNQEWVAPSLNTTADGSLYFTVLDLAKWDAALYTEKLLKRSSLEQMWTPVKLNDGKTHPYGFGWFLHEIHGHKIIEHEGAWQGFTTAIARYVDDKVTVVALTNLDSLHSRPEEIVHGVAGLYVPELTPPPPPKAIEDKEPQVTELFRNFLQSAAQGKADPELFTRDARKRWSSDRLKEFQTVLNDLGEVKSIDLLERKEEGSLRIYRYRINFAERPLSYILKLNSDSKIAELESAD